MSTALTVSTPTGLIDRRSRAHARRRTMISLALLAPVMAFMVLAFALPLASVLYNAVSGGGAERILPHTAARLADWDGASDLDDGFYGGLGEELRQADRNGETANLARMLNYRISGYRSLLLRTTRELKESGADVTRAGFIAIDPRWGDAAHIAAIADASSRLSGFFLLSALDLKRDPVSGISRMPEERRIYLDYLARTLWMCFVVTLSCLLLGYPLAYLIASTRGRTARVLLMLVMLSFWTSILVRTAAWVIILRTDGLVNGGLQFLGLTGEPLELLYNRFAVYLCMVHVLLPFMILPIYSVMKGLPASLMKAASSLGAPPLAAFLQVYLPLTLPGLSAGVLFTYILALGFYITPALVGGANDQMISSLIARFALGEAHWSMAAALAIVLLISAGLIYLVFSRIAPLERGGAIK